MKKLIIAEKPSLAKNIANALNVKDRKDGFIENDNYIISWAFGHILELYSIYDYLGEKRAWKDIPLPYIPQEFHYKLKNDEGVKKQFNILKELINRNDVELIVNCGDADREGQLIIDNIIKYIGTTKQIKRLWLPEQTEETIRKEIENLKDNSNYINLFNEGMARTRLDWLLGINLTVFLTVKSGQKLATGRVLIPIVKYIFDRDMEIKNFIPQNYYQSEGILTKDNMEITLVSDKKFNEQSEADNYSQLLTGKVKVNSVEEKEVVKQPSKLFSLSNLQSFLSKGHKIDFATSMKVIQSLYEKGLITYPRTNTEYLAENEKEKVKKLIEVFEEYQLEFKVSKKIFDNSKIESHSAIIPTTKKADNLEGLEEIIYTVIRNRFIANFLQEKTITKKLTVELISLTDPETTFKLTGETVVNEGFYKYEPKDFKDPLPNFSKDEELYITFYTREKQTQSKKKVTEEELSRYLKNPFRKELKENDDEEYRAILEGIEIGTEATRTGIIENAKKYGYISQKNSYYSIEELGIRLIEILDKLKINLYADRTVEFSKLLKSIYKNEKQSNELLELGKKELEEIINQEIEIEKIKNEESLESLGTCPMCGKGQIHQRKSKEGKIFYNCSNQDCKFFLWEQAKHFNNPIKITKSKLKNLLNNKKEAFKLKNKEGKEYEAYLKIKINNNYVNFEIDGFKNTTNKK